MKKPEAVSYGDSSGFLENACVSAYLRQRIFHRR